MAPARKANDYNVAIMGSTSGYVFIVSCTELSPIFPEQEP